MYLLTGSDIWLSTPSNNVLFFRSNCVCCGLSMNFSSMPSSYFYLSINMWLLDVSRTSKHKINLQELLWEEKWREREQTSKCRYNMMTALCWKIKWLHQYTNLTVCPKCKTYEAIFCIIIIVHNPFIFILDNTRNITLDHLENHQLQSKESEMANNTGWKVNFVCQGKVNTCRIVSKNCRYRPCNYHWLQR